MENKINEIIAICSDILTGETFLEESVVDEILQIALEIKSEM